MFSSENLESYLGDTLKLSVHLPANFKIKQNYGLGMSKKEFIIWFTSSGLVKEPPWIDICPELRFFIIRILLPLQIQLLGVHSKYLVTVSLIIKRLSVIFSWKNQHQKDWSLILVYSLVPKVLFLFFLSDKEIVISEQLFEISRRFQKFQLFHSARSSLWDMEIRWNTW